MPIAKASSELWAILGMFFVSIDSTYDVDDNDAVVEDDDNTQLTTIIAEYILLCGFLTTVKNTPGKS